MADKKDDKKPEGGGGYEGWEIAAIIITIFLVIYLLGGLTSYVPVYNKAVSFFADYSGPLSKFTATFSKDAKSTLGFLIGLSFPVSVMLLIGIIISIERLKRIRAREHVLFNTPVVQAYDPNVKGDPELTDRWRKILELGSSLNENDWRQAIIFADVILEDILDRMGYKGEGIGEKLKSVDRGDFKTLDQAWDAHKVRNAIAHEADFKLSQHEAKRVINMYQQVFEEFSYI
jgi:hypothetical protein